MEVEEAEQQNGSGTTVQDINKFMKSFEMTQNMMKQMKSKKGGIRKTLKGMNLDNIDLKNLKIQLLMLKNIQKARDI